VAPVKKKASPKKRQKKKKASDLGTDEDEVACFEYSLSVFCQSSLLQEEVPLEPDDSGPELEEPAAVSSSFVYRTVRLLLWRLLAVSLPFRTTVCALDGACVCVVCLCVVCRCDGH
jgi:hypothetical protein